MTNVYHLAHMIALLGPLPKEFLERIKGDGVRSWFDVEWCVVFFLVHFALFAGFYFILFINASVGRKLEGDCKGSKGVVVGCGKTP